MASESVLSVIFLWHQHQPFYKDPLSGQYELPWVRLHATKDYLDMVSLLDEFPKIRASFNLVPSLLIQLDDYAQGKAKDPFLSLSQKPAAELSFEDRQFLLRNFFMAHEENRINPFPRYRELLDKRGRSISEEALSRAQNYFKEQDWRDLQVWFNLAWMDPLWQQKEPLVAQLYGKGKNFTEADKRQLLDLQQALCARVVPKHKELMERGQIEVSATPFYHPILPLLCDTESARMAMPQAVLPQSRFAFPEDARQQIEKALEDHRLRFGRRSAGMWPSEGSVSEAAAGLFLDAGVRWIATDEAVLAKSWEGDAFRREDMYEPYQFIKEGRALHIFFRDHELSDAIGFTYAGWEAPAAAADFIRRLHEIQDRL